MVELNCDLISLNSVGLRDYEKHHKVFHYLKQQTSKSAIILCRKHIPLKVMKRYGPISLAVEVVQLYFPTKNLMCEVF